MPMLERFTVGCWIRDSLSANSSGEEIKMVLGFAFRHCRNSTCALEDLEPPTKITRSCCSANCRICSIRCATFRHVERWGWTADAVGGWTASLLDVGPLALLDVEALRCWILSMSCWYPSSGIVVCAKRKISLLKSMRARSSGDSTMMAELFVCPCNPMTSACPGLP